MGIALVTCATALYVVHAQRLRRRDVRGWSGWRTAGFVTGAWLCAWALVPAWLPLGDGELPQHMLQHLLLGMYAPLLLALGSPVTLIFRSQPVGRVAATSRILRARPLRALAHPVPVLGSMIGVLVLVYLGPLYAFAERHEVVHALLHAHFFVTGYTFAWVIAGADPAPHRPAVRVRLVWLGVAIAAHAAVAQLLYAGVRTDLGVPVAERRAAGDLMYYGGDIGELLLALAVLTNRPLRPRAVRGASRPTPGVMRLKVEATGPSGTVRSMDD